MIDNNSNQLSELQERRKKILEKIKKIEDIFKEEKDNEEAWAGHSSTRYQTAEIDHQVLLELLKGIEEEVKKLS